MALDARTRSSIDDSLVPLIGEINANALMTEFPSIEADELVTKQFLRAELTGEVGSIRQELAELETRLTVRLGAGLGVATAVLATLITLH